jgi:hypothetical protein
MRALVDRVDVHSDEEGTAVTLTKLVSSGA